MWLKYMSVSIQNDIGHCNDAQFFCDARTEFLNIIFVNLFPVIKNDHILI